MKRKLVLAIVTLVFAGCFQVDAQVKYSNEFLAIGVYPFYFENEYKYIDRVNEV